MSKNDLMDKKENARQAHTGDGLSAHDDYALLGRFLRLCSDSDSADELAARLINTFGSIGNVISADVQELMEVEGCGRRMAFLLSGMCGIERHIRRSRNNSISRLDSPEIRCRFFLNLLYSRSEERLLLTTLDRELNIIGTHSISVGSIGFLGAAPADITRAVLNDKPYAAVIAHNHPNGKSTPSLSDINFTLRLCAWLEQLDVLLLDHIIVGGDRAQSLEALGYSEYLSGNIS